MVAYLKDAMYGKVYAVKTMNPISVQVVNGNTDGLEAANYLYCRITNEDKGIFLMVFGQRLIAIYDKYSNSEDGLCEGKVYDRQISLAGGTFNGRKIKDHLERYNILDGVLISGYNHKAKPRSNIKKKHIAALVNMLKNVRNANILGIDLNDCYERTFLKKEPVEVYLANVNRKKYDSSWVNECIQLTDKNNFDKPIDTVLPDKSITRDDSSTSQAKEVNQANNEEVNTKIDDTRTLKDESMTLKDESRTLKDESRTLKDEVLDNSDDKTTANISNHSNNDSETITDDENTGSTGKRQSLSGEESLKLLYSLVDAVSKLSEKLDSFIKSQESNQEKEQASNKLEEALTNTTKSIEQLGDRLTNIESSIQGIEKSYENRYSSDNMNEVIAELRLDIAERDKELAEYKRKSDLAEGTYAVNEINFLSQLKAGNKFQESYDTKKFQYLVKVPLPMSKNSFIGIVKMANDYDGIVCLVDRSDDLIISTVLRGYGKLNIPDNVFGTVRVNYENIYVDKMRSFGNLTKEERMRKFIEVANRALTG